MSVPFERMLFDPSTQETITFVGGTSTVTLGPEVDEIDVDAGDGGRYTATVAHPFIDRSLPLGGLAAINVVSAPVTVTLVRADDETQTIEGTFEVNLQLPPIARP